MLDADCLRAVLVFLRFVFGWMDRCTLCWWAGIPHTAISLHIHGFVASLLDVCLWLAMARPCIDAAAAGPCLFGMVVGSPLF